MRPLEKAPETFSGNRAESGDILKDTSESLMGHFDDYTALGKGPRARLCRGHCCLRRW
jgi:hypothetical protein